MKIVINLEKVIIKDSIVRLDKQEVVYNLSNGSKLIVPLESEINKELKECKLERKSALPYVSEFGI